MRLKKHFFFFFLLIASPRNVLITAGDALSWHLGAMTKQLNLLSNVTHSIS